VNSPAEALMMAPDVVSTNSTMAVLLRAPHAMFRPRTLLAPAETTGATQDAKKLEGYIEVMVPPETMAKVTRKNVNVRVALAFPAVRSEGEMVKIAVEVQPIMHIPDGPIKT
jgi:hypothetical protein